jgi:RNA polymerase sigma-70 factor (ECF subfamily)
MCDINHIGDVLRDAKFPTGVEEPRHGARPLPSPPRLRFNRYTFLGVRLICREDRMERTRLDAATLFRRYSPVVARFLRALGVSKQDREDLLQEVFLVAHRRGGFDPQEARPSTWLLRIAALVVSVDRRAKRRRREVLALDAVELAPEPAAGAAEVLEEAEAHRRLLAAIGGMKSDSRKLLIAFLVEEQGCQDIAHDLGVPVGTVYSRLHRTRKALARAASSRSTP